MDTTIYNIRISPEVLSGDLFVAPYLAGNTPAVSGDPCCTITTTIPSSKLTGFTYVYSSMTQILSGGTNGDSLLTGLTVPILLTQTAVDFGYYSVFDGMILQQDVMNNFIFTGSTFFPNNFVVNVYNTSEVELKKYLSFSNYQIDWGDGSPIFIITPSTPTPYTHTYSSSDTYTISMSGMSPWGYNTIKKNVHIPFSDVVVNNPNGTAYFTPLGGSWSATSFNYNYIYSGDSDCDASLSGFTTFLSASTVTITGFTDSRLDDIEVYASLGDPNFHLGKYKIGLPVTGASNNVGTYWGANPNGYTAYTINDVDYLDFPEKLTLFVVTGVTQIEMICEPLTKNEALLNVIDEPQIITNVFIERGKTSGIETMVRLGEVDNFGDLNNYGYGFFRVTNF
jgi:hypothetical protein